MEFAVCVLDRTHELWMLLDKTEHDQAQRALRRSEDYLRSIVNTAVDAIITINQYGTVETFNLAAEQMFGYTAAEVVGQNIRLLMPQPYRQERRLLRYLKIRRPASSASVVKWSGSARTARRSRWISRSARSTTSSASPVSFAI